MAQTVSLSASPRQATGKGAARQARFRGRVPAVIYGHGRDTQPLELEAKALEKALQGVEPASTIIELAVDGKTVKTLIREIQRHPIRPDIIHVDDIGPDGVALDLANQRLHRLAVHRELDDRARGLDSLERLFERLGLELERLCVAPVPVDHGWHLAAEARLPRGALAGRLAGAC